MPLHHPAISHRRHGDDETVSCASKSSTGFGQYGLPLSMQISSSSRSLPCSAARNCPSSSGSITTYTASPPPPPSRLSRSMNCVSSGTSRPDVPIRWVIHHSLNRKQHMNLKSLGAEGEDVKALGLVGGGADEGAVDEPGAGGVRQRDVVRHAGEDGPAMRHQPPLRHRYPRRHRHLPP
ncbi:Os03g0808950, partial [Oryza sativa Japonica Group]